MSLPRLPNELLHQILASLPASSLKAARLTTPHLAAVGAPLLLTRIYLAPRPHTLAAFRAITAHPVISRTVTELVYDDSLLEAALADKAGHFPACVRRALEAGEGVPSDAEMHASLFRYVRLFDRQERILGGGQFEAILREGLRRLPHLRRITVVGAGGLPVTVGRDGAIRPSMSAEEVEDLGLWWYSTTGPLGRDCEGTLMPAVWVAFMDEKEDPIGWDGWANEEPREKEEDGRGRGVLMRAVKGAGVRVEVVGVGEKEVRAMVERGRKGEEEEGGREVEVEVEMGVHMDGLIERLLREEETEEEHEEFDEDFFSLI